MSQIELKYLLDPNDPLDKATLNRLLKNDAAYGVLWSFYNEYLRNKLKYDNLTDEQYKVYEEVKNKLAELEEQYNIDWNNDYI